MLEVELVEVGESGSGGSLGGDGGGISTPHNRSIVLPAGRQLRFLFKPKHDFSVREFKRGKAIILGFGFEEELSLNTAARHDARNGQLY
ncbi:hypothetical protein N7539_009577 [Penicillium diatomitis]|uniref:Uncharacterized protein n=1 Tax=Penicillium diatomitis TaxID=2819901 RepID=A0A9W9WKG4_9EURO|nr:uncharacterized protein N7539_009577 [Penicillium diatomitis]KAJ5466621.1 hypothetical protein N7539_009577 [Penicillium diatomitis]